MEFARRAIRVAAGAAAFVAAFAATAAAQQVVNVYSGRQEVLIQPQLKAFTAATGIAVNFVSAGDDALIERMKAEGANSPADILLTVDVGRLIRAKTAGLLRPVESELLAASIPPQFHDGEGYWIGLGMRGRVFFYSPERVDLAELSTYEDLADPKWRGRICIRSSSNVYNQSLLGAMIAHNGPQVAESWAAGVAANMARPPQGGDRDQIAAVAAGECDIAVANTYYFAGMRNGTSEEQAAAAKVRLFWPSQDGAGAHVNISGGGVAANAPHPENALRLLEFLAGEEAQRIYAEVVYEYPVRPGVGISEALLEFGAFKADTLNLDQVAAHQDEALRIFDRIGWR
jgi:iron(III) transport system substrate-binding protein